VIADLVERVPTLKNKGARKVIQEAKQIVIARWKFLANAKWGDGHPITCADLKLSWQVGLNPNVSTVARNYYTKINKVDWEEATPQECNVTYANGDWSYDRDLPFPIPSHLEAAIYEKFKDQPEGYDRNSTYVKNPTAAATSTPVKK
jgi:peptide/nickel transport system substrate-binding protein